jgi:hypothetical protein
MPAAAACPLRATKPCRSSAVKPVQACSTPGQPAAGSSCICTFCRCSWRSCGHIRFWICAETSRLPRMLHSVRLVRLVLCTASQLLKLMVDSGVLQLAG